MQVRESTLSSRRINHKFFYGTFSRADFAPLQFSKDKNYRPLANTLARDAEGAENAE
jgi:hypothetical protein